MFSAEQRSRVLPIDPEKSDLINYNTWVLEFRLLLANGPDFR
jgi:hypothetical protein